MEREQLRGNLIKLLTAVGLVLMCGFVVYGIAAGLFTSQQKMEVFCTARRTVGAAAFHGAAGHPGGDPDPARRHRLSGRRAHVRAGEGFSL